MKRSPAPNNPRAPHPAIVCPNPMSAGIRTPAEGHVMRDPHIPVRTMIYPYSVRRKIIIKIRNIQTSRDIFVWLFVIFFLWGYTFVWNRDVNKMIKICFFMAVPLSLTLFMYY
jgi:hypothetical protein